MPKGRQLVGMEKGAGSGIGGARRRVRSDSDGLRERSMSVIAWFRQPSFENYRISFFASSGMSSLCRRYTQGFYHLQGFYPATVCDFSHSRERRMTDEIANPVNSPL